VVEALVVLAQEIGAVVAAVRRADDGVIQAKCVSSRWASTAVIFTAAWPSRAQSK
jgi:hypothetical protein